MSICILEDDVMLFCASYYAFKSMEPVCFDSSAEIGIVKRFKSFCPPQLGIELDHLHGSYILATLNHIEEKKTKVLWVYIIYLEKACDNVNSIMAGAENVWCGW